MSAYDSLQDARYRKEALRPEAVLVDERDVSDRLAFVGQLAQVINYYDSNNKVAGSWLPFVLKEPAILLAVIARTPVQEFTLQFSSVQAVLKPWLLARESAGAAADAGTENNNGAPDSGSAATQISAGRGQINSRQNITQSLAAKDIPEQILYGLQQLLNILRNLFVQFNHWHGAMQLSLRDYDLRRFLQMSITHTLADLLGDSIRVHFQLHQAVPRFFACPTSEDYAEFDPLWQVQGARWGGRASADTPSEACAQAAGRLLGLFHPVFDIFVQLIRSAGDGCDELLLQGSDSPDTALLIAFCDLLKWQQQRINQFSRAHLDFYYRDVLHLRPQAAEPDRVWAALTLAAGVDEFTLPANTPFLAGTATDGSPILFATTGSSRLNQAQLIGAYSQCYKPNTGVALSPCGPLNQVRMSPSQQPLSWNLFAAVAQTPLNIGFVIASPMLYLPGGSRTLGLLFEFETPPPANFLQQCQLFLSTAKGWLEVQPQPLANSTNSTNPVDAAGTSLRLTLQLDGTAPAIAPMSAALAGLSSPWPLFKCSLGPQVDLTQVPRLLSCTIDVTVADSSAELLSSDQALLPKAGPVVPWGPGPEVGANLYIGCPEVFAKPFAKLCIGFYWEGLPASFDAYYSAYNHFLNPPQAAVPAAPANTAATATPEAYFHTGAFEGIWSALSLSTWLPLLDSGSAQPVTQPPSSPPQSPLPAGQTGSNSGAGVRSDYATALFPVTGQNQAPGSQASGSQSPGSQAPATPAAHPPPDSPPGAAQGQADATASGAAGAARVDSERDLSERLGEKLREELGGFKEEVDRALEASVIPVLKKALGPFEPAASPSGQPSGVLSHNSQPQLAPAPGANAQSPLATVPLQPNSPRVFQLTALASNGLAAQPELVASPIVPPAKASGGYLRLQLSAPALGFGQSLFAQVVNQVALENAQFLIAQAKAPAPQTSTTPSPTAPPPTTPPAGNPASTPSVAAASGGQAQSAANAGALVKDGLIAAATGGWPQFIGRLVKGLVVGVVKNRLTKALGGWFARLQAKPAAAPDDPQPDNQPPLAPAVNESQTPVPTALQALPNPPYTPKLKRISIGYSATARVSFSAQDAYPAQLFYVDLFKTRLADAAAAQPGLPLFSPDAGLRACYLHLSQVTTGQCRFYAQIEPGPRAWALDAKRFCYWSAQGWQPAQVLFDYTRNLSQSGLFALGFNLDMVSDGANEQFFPPGPPSPLGKTLWLRILAADADEQVQLIYLAPGGVELARVDSAALPLGQSPRLAANQLQGPQQKIAQLASCMQPFASFSGKAAEDCGEFDWRVSNRLQTKGRLHSASDYERLLLAANEEVYYARACLDVDAQGGSQVRLYLVPRAANPQAPGAFRPQAKGDLLEQIRSAVAAQVSPLVRFSVDNCSLTPVWVTAEVIVHSDLATAEFAAALNQTIKLFLSPWIAQPAGERASLSAGFSRGALVQLLLAQTGVLAVKQLNIYQALAQQEHAGRQYTRAEGAPEGFKQVNSDTIQPEGASGILISANDHQVQCLAASLPNKNPLSGVA